MRFPPWGRQRLRCLCLRVGVCVCFSASKTEDVGSFQEGTKAHSFVVKPCQSFSSLSCAWLCLHPSPSFSTSARHNPRPRATPRPAFGTEERKVGSEYPLGGSETRSLDGSRLDKSLHFTKASPTSCPPKDQSSPVPPKN